MQTDVSGRPYVMISSDCHAGADLPDYRPYLEAKWHDEFDAWSATYSDAWAGIDTTSEWKAGVSSFLSPLNWDSDARLRALENEGIVAEVLFPNTTPPFFPNGLLAAPGPRTREEYDRRWAGVRAHNRWMKDFCAAAPGRRLGVAQLFIDDIDDAVAEIRWAKDNGLRQVLLPSDHHLKLHNLYYASLDPIWSVCEELDMPVGRHGSVVGSDVEAASVDAAHACGVFETTYFGHRTLFQMVLSGVFERHPNLKFVFTELGAANWVIEAKARLDGFCKGATMDGTIPAMFAGRAVAKLSMMPSEYVRRNCYFGATVSGPDVKFRHDLGIDRLMWGADFPHHEGTVPYTLKALRATVAEIPEDELREIFAGTAAAVYGADMAQLQEIADRVGFTPEQVAKPLGRDEIPDDPNFMMMFVAPTTVFGGKDPALAH
jgi:predicted TIM-barrel fold metal-dependent hydrolase